MSEFIALYNNGDPINIRKDQILSFEHHPEYGTTAINDGTEGMVMLSDPDAENYNRLCNAFGLISTERGGTNVKA